MDGLEELVAAHERKKLRIQLDDELSKRFDGALAEHGFANWITGIPILDEDGDIGYMYPSKFRTKFEFQGLHAWLKFSLMQNHPFLQQYHGIEEHFKEWDDNGWFFAAEKEDALIVVSNFKMRSKLIGLL